MYGVGGDYVRCLGLKLTVRRDIGIAGCMVWVGTMYVVWG